MLTLSYHQHAVESLGLSNMKEGSILEEQSLP